MFQAHFRQELDFHLIRLLVGVLVLDHVLPVGLEKIVVAGPLHDGLLLKRQRSGSLGRKSLQP